MATESEKNLMRANIAHFNFTPEEQEQVIREVSNLRHDRAVINTAARNLRIQTKWTTMPTNDFSGTMAEWFAILVDLTLQTVDAHFKDEPTRERAFILVSPESRIFLWGSGKFTSSNVAKPGDTSFCHDGLLGGVPVYVDFYLPPNVVYVGSGNLATFGEISIESMSAIKFDTNLFDLDKLKQ